MQHFPVFNRIEGELIRQCNQLWDSPRKAIEMPLAAKVTPNLPIRRKVPTTTLILLARALFAALVLVIITTLAKTVGSRWSGIFAAFPTTVLPTVWVLHYHYSARTISALFREIPLGMLAIVVFACSVHITFPALGVYLGIGVSYGVAFGYLLFYEYFLRHPLDKLLSR